MSKKVIIVGGEGNGGVIATCIEDNRERFGDFEWEIVGFINDYEEEVNGYPVIGKLESIPELIDSTDCYFSWGIHLVGRNVLTEKLYRTANFPKDRLATIIHKSAFVAKNAIIEPGVFVMANSYIGPGALIKSSSLIMANCMIGHNIEMDELCHCSVGSIMTGYSKMGLCSDLAVGSTLLAYKKIGDFAMLGASSLATKDIPDYEIHVGCPSKYLKKVRLD